MMRRAPLTLLLCLFTMFATVVRAEQVPAGAEADRWGVFGDVLLRWDFVNDLPGGRPDLERGRFSGRIGIRRTFGSFWDAAVSCRMAEGSDGNGAARRNFDNTKSDAVELDRFDVRGYFPAGELTLGKQQLPLQLSPSIWDRDLRPVGAGYLGVADVRELDAVAFAGGLFVADHPLDDDPSLAALQVDWRIREGAPAGGSVTLSYATFDELDDVVAAGLARTNRQVAGRLVSDFDLLDLELGLRVPAGRLIFSSHVELLQNLGADSAADGFVATLVLRSGHERGTRTHGRGWQVGVTSRRLQREAALAGFNGDDWWFPTAMRGTRVRVARRAGRSVLSLSLSAERRDDLDDRLHRVLLDVTYRVGGRR